MSFLAKFGLTIFASVLVALVIFCIGLGVQNYTLCWISCGIGGAIMLACIALLVTNEVYEVRNDIPFQW